MEDLLLRPAVFELYFEGRPLSSSAKHSLWNVTEVHIDGDEEVHYISILYVTDKFFFNMLQALQNETKT